MNARVMARRCLVASLACVCAAAPGSLRLAAQELGSEAQRESGRRLYAKYCAQCHGDKGDGQGYATPHLFPRPRDFTTGKFKVRTTANGALPTHDDLVGIIRHGMPYTSMPAWPRLSDQDVANLAYYVKTFSPAFADAARAPTPIELPSAPAMTDETIAAGRKLYEDTGCVRCHGALGRGDGPSARTLKDDADQPIRAADLTQRWTFRAGASREDIFRTMSTGFNGTPMPSFSDSLSTEQRWAITDFIASLSASERADYTNIVIARHVNERIDPARGAEIFATAPVARLPIVGQIMQPGRQFHPPTTSVTVQAIHDGESMALLVRWHDMSAEQSGSNAPSLPVPVEDEEAAAVTVGSPDDPFGNAAVAEAETADPFAEAAAPAAPASEFSDAVAVQVPVEVRTDARKPYFIFGDAQNAVDLWFFDLATSAPVRFTGKGSADITPADTGTLTGVASYEQGQWSVIFMRPLRAESAAPFSSGEFMPIAFSVWDGFSRERGNRRGLTLWYSLYVEPDVVPSAAGPMVRTALIVLGLELVVIGWVRWRFRSRAREGLGREPGSPAATSA